MINSIIRIGRTSQPGSTAANPRSCLCATGRLVLGVVLALTTLPASANSRPLVELTLEELANLPIISVSKMAKPIAKAPASVYLITQDIIAQTGAQTLPEALRLAPNLQVARVDARNYAINARGFNNRFANKLLVLIDGRTVYSPLFSGVFWEAQDVLMEDLDRIEVVSGPGSTLWGANAVNGVVNIVSRSAKETQGALVSAGAGNQLLQVGARYGGAFENHGHYRVYAKYADHDDLKREDGSDSRTGWHRGQTGFQMDWVDDEDTLSVHGDLYSGTLQQPDDDDIDIGGANLVARLRRRILNASFFSVKAYIDHTHRDQPGDFTEHLNTFDLEVQHEWLTGKRMELVWGGGYRYADDRIENGETFAFLPEDDHLSWANVFFHNNIKLAEPWHLSVGAKFERNPFTGWEWLPGVQVTWAPANEHLVWTSVSRSVRSPSRIDRDLYRPSEPPVVDGEPQYILAGGPDFESEVVHTYEVGYRSQLSSGMVFSATAFFSQYDDLRTLEPNPDGAGLVFENKANADSYGLELWGSWQAAEHWRLHAGLVLQNFEVDLDPGSADISNTTTLANTDPSYYWQLRSVYDVSEDVEFAAMVRGTDELENSEIPEYTSLDLRLGWELSDDTTLSLIGQNLLESEHLEFGTGENRTEIERAVFGKLEWRY